MKHVLIMDEDLNLLLHQEEVSKFQKYIVRKKSSKHHRQKKKKKDHWALLGKFEMSH